MTYFADKTGYILSVSMTDRNTHTDFENEFFEVGGLKLDDDGHYIVDDIDYLLDQAKDCWACNGDFADCGEPDEFDLYCRIIDNAGVVYRVFDSYVAANMVKDYNVPYSAVI